MATDDQLLAEATTDAHPAGIKPGFNVGQQIGEMLELGKSLAQLSKIGLQANRSYLALQQQGSKNPLKELFGKRSKRLSKYTRQLNDPRLWTLKDHLDFLVQANLTNQLVVKPTVQALNSFRPALKKFGDLLAKYSNGEPFVVHGKADRASSSEYDFSGYPYDYYSYGATWNHTVEVHVTAMVRITSDLSLMRDDIKRAYFGLGPRLDTAVELFPWSFVISWFIDVCSAARNWSSRPIDSITFDVLSSGWSKTTTSEGTGYIDVCSGAYRTYMRRVSADGAIAPGRRTLRTYKRELRELPWSTFAIPSPDIGLPNLGQVGTLAQLIYTLTTDTKDLARLAFR
jgi:hypothetical protein